MDKIFLIHSNIATVLSKLMKNCISNYPEKFTLLITFNHSSTTSTYLFALNRRTKFFFYMFEEKYTKKNFPGDNNASTTVEVHTRT